MEQKIILDSLAPAKILEQIEKEGTEEGDEDKEKKLNTMSGQFCYINPNRYEDNMCNTPPFKAIKG